MNGFKRGLETAFETFLFNSRLIVILAVLGSLTSSVLMFVRGAMLIWHAAVDFVKHIGGPQDGHDELSVTLISSVDSFLFATVLLIFAMGIYELFISKIDPASRTADSRPNWLQIHSLDDLKSAIGKVILMILIVRLFETAVKMKYDRPLDLLYLGLGVVFVAVALYLQHLGHSKKHAHAEESDEDAHGEEAHVAHAASAEPKHSTETATTHVAIVQPQASQIPPPPLVPNLAPTIAHPREYPLPQAAGPAYPPPQAQAPTHPHAPSPSPSHVPLQTHAAHLPPVPPPPPPVQSQYPQAPQNGQHSSMNAPPPWSQLGQYVPPRS